MRKKFQRMPSKAARWSPRFGWLALVLLILAAICHRFGVLASDYFFVMVGCVAFLGLVAFILALKGFLDLWQRADKGGGKSIKGLILAFLALLPIIAAAVAYFVFPPFYDIATDSETPPHFIANNRPSDALPVQQSLYYQANEQLAMWPELSGRRYDGSPDKILPAVLSVIDDLGWKHISQAGEVGKDNMLLVEATAKTPVLGFVSDIIIRLNDEGDTTFVDMRATSRYLSHDLGIDARFILNFMEALDVKVLLTPSDQREE